MSTSPGTGQEASLLPGIVPFLRSLVPLVTLFFSTAVFLFIMIFLSTAGLLGIPSQVFV